MMARRTIKLPEEEYERHNKRRKEMGLTWAEYIDGQSANIEDSIRNVIRDESEYEYVCRECEHVKYSIGPINESGDVGDVIECPECGNESFVAEGKAL